MTRLHRYGWELALAALLMIEILGFGALNPRLLDLNVLLFSTSDFICIGIVALPLTMVIVSGGIDISFGSTMGLCAIALGVMFQGGVPLPLAIILTLALGALCGLINAGLIIYTGVNPLIITLGTLYLFGGSALLLSGMAGATGYEGIGGFRRASPILPISMCWICPSPDLLSRQRDLFLVADAPDPRRTQCLPDWAEPRVALYSAIPVNRTLYALYAMTGFASAVAAVLLVSYFGSAFRSGCLFPDASYYSGRPGRRQYLRRLRVNSRYCHRRAVGGLSAAGIADGWRAQSGIQRPLRRIANCRCRRSFCQPASSANQRLAGASSRYPAGLKPIAIKEKYMTIQSIKNCCNQYP